MSLSNHRYTARIAPSSSTAADALHNGATIVEGGELFRESIATGCLAWPMESVPVLLGHDENRRVGFVTGVAERDGWHECEFVLDMDRPRSRDALDLLRVGAPMSIGAISLAKDEALANLGTATSIKRHTRAVLQEISIVEPGFVAAYPGAKVTKIVERETPLARLHRQRQERERAQAIPKTRRMPNGDTERDLPDGSTEITHSGRRLFRSPHRGRSSLVAHLRSLPDDSFHTTYDEYGVEISRTRLATR